MGFFASSRGGLAETTRIIERVLEELGVAPAECRLAECETPAWALTHGEVEVYVFVNTGDDGVYLQVVAPVMAIPAGDLLPLYRRLLEINGDEILGAALGLKGENVIITTDRRAVDLDRSEVREMILRVGDYAAHFARELGSEFGDGRKVA